VEYVRENPPKGFFKFRERWYAVDLNCAVIHEHLTTTDGDGKEIQIYREAVSVKPGEPPADYFDIPPDYQERGPAEINNEYGARFPGRSVCPKQEAADKLQQLYEADKLRLALFAGAQVSVFWRDVGVSPSSRCSVLLINSNHVGRLRGACRTLPRTPLP